MSKIPIFKNEDEEAKFWDTHDVTDFLEETEEVEMKFTDDRKKKRTTLYLPLTEHETIRKMAFDKKISMNEFIRQAIKDKLNKINPDRDKRV